MTVCTDSEQCEAQAADNWSKILIERLRQLDISSELRFTLAQYLDEYEFFCGKIAETETKLRQILTSKRHSAAIEIFKSYPGVGNIVAWEYRAEMLTYQ